MSTSLSEGNIVGTAPAFSERGSVADFLLQTAAVDLTQLWALASTVAKAGNRGLSHHSEGESPQPKKIPSHPHAGPTATKKLHVLWADLRSRIDELQNVICNTSSLRALLVDYEPMTFIVESLVGIVDASCRILNSTVSDITQQSRRGFSRNSELKFGLGTGTGVQEATGSVLRLLESLVLNFAIVRRLICGNAEVHVGSGERPPAHTHGTTDDGIFDTDFDDIIGESNDVLDQQSRYVLFGQSFGSGYSHAAGRAAASPMPRLSALQISALPVLCRALGTPSIQSDPTLCTTVLTICTKCLDGARPAVLFKLRDSLVTNGVLSSIMFARHASLQQTLRTATKPAKETHLSEEADGDREQETLSDLADLMPLTEVVHIVEESMTSADIRCAKAVYLFECLVRCQRIFECTETQLIAVQMQALLPPKSHLFHHLFADGCNLIETGGSPDARGLGGRIAALAESSSTSSRTTRAVLRFFVAILSRYGAATESCLDPDATFDGGASGGVPQGHGTNKNPGMVISSCSNATRTSTGWRTGSVSVNMKTHPRFPLVPKMIRLLRRQVDKLSLHVAPHFERLASDHHRICVVPEPIERQVRQCQPLKRRKSEKATGQADCVDGGGAGVDLVTDAVTSDGNARDGSVPDIHCHELELYVLRDPSRNALHQRPRSNDCVGVKDTYIGGQSLVWEKSVPQSSLHPSLAATMSAKPKMLAAEDRVMSGTAAGWVSGC